MRCALAASALLGAASAQWEPEDLPVYMPTEQHELEAYEPKADAKSTVVAGSARFTVLSERLIRMEYSESGSFEDKATMGFLNRQSDAAFNAKKSGGGVTISTAALTLTYSGGGKFSAANLHVKGKGGGAFSHWQPEMSNDGNLLGTIKSLDTIGPTSLNCTENADIKVHSETLHCTWGLVSRAGWSIYDDSDSPVLNEYGWWGEPSEDKKTTTWVNNSDTQVRFVLVLVLVLVLRLRLLFRLRLRLRLLLLLLLLLREANPIDQWLAAVEWSHKGLLRGQGVAGWVGCSYGDVQHYQPHVK